MTNAYLASLAREADTVVTKLGCVTLQQLASTFKLPVEVALRMTRDTFTRFDAGVLCGMANAR